MVRRRKNKLGMMYCEEIQDNVTYSSSLMTSGEISQSHTNDVIRPPGSELTEKERDKEHLTEHLIFKLLLDVVFSLEQQRGIESFDTLSTFFKKKKCFNEHCNYTLSLTCD